MKRPTLIILLIFNFLFTPSTCFNVFYAFAETDSTSNTNGQLWMSELSTSDNSLYPMPTLIIPESCNIDVDQQGERIIVRWNESCFPNSYYVSISFKSYSGYLIKNTTTQNNGYYSVSLIDLNMFSITRIYICLKGNGDQQNFCGSIEVEITDNEKPSGQISNIHSSYNIGDIVNFYLTASDNRNLSKLQFTVKNNSDAILYNRNWSVSGTYASQSSSFSTDSWEAGRYSYTLHIVDSSDNTQYLSGYFNLLDSIKPTGFIYNLRNNYNVGDIIECNVRAQDETSLRYVRFKVTDSDNYMYSWSRELYSHKIYQNIITFKTDSWNEGLCNCILTIIDSNENTSIYNYSFMLSATKPSKPYAPTAYAINSRTIRVSWNVSNDDLSVSLWREFDGIYKKIYCISKPYDYNRSYFYDSDSIQPDTTYSYKIKTSKSETGCYNQAVWSDFSDIFTVKTLEEQDINAPTGRVSISPDILYQNDSFLYSIEAWDNKFISEISFKITNQYGANRFNIQFMPNNIYFHKSGVLKTNSWGEGTFYYNLYLKDNSNNVNNYNGSFEILPFPEISFEIPEMTKAIPGHSVSIPITLYNPGKIPLEGIDIIFFYDNNILDGTSATLAGGILENKGYSLINNFMNEGKIHSCIFAIDSLNNSEGLILNIKCNVIGKIGDKCELLLNCGINEKEKISSMGIVEIIDTPHSLPGSSQLIDCQSNNPVKNATILINNSYETYSNDEGIFYLKADQPEIYTISVNGYFPYTKTLSIVNHENQISAIPVCPIRKKAIIIAGSQKNDHLWDAYKLCSTDAYDYLIDEYEIKYLGPDSTPDAASAESIGKAITEWAKDADELLLYMVDHGISGQFVIDQSDHSKNIEVSLLKRCLDDLQNTMKGTIIVIFDACNSGSFVSELSPPPGKQRIIITSTRDKESALFLIDGNFSFSHHFWNCRAMKFNKSIKEAYYDTLDIIQLPVIGLPTPQVDANGNGIPNEDDDFKILKTIFIRKKHHRDISLENPRKRFVIGTNISDEVILQGYSTYSINAILPNEMDDVKKVTAIIIPPDYQQVSPDVPITNLIQVDLERIANNYYESVYNDLYVKGTYYISIYAIDSESSYSLLKRLSIVQKGEPVPDEYENDNSLFLSNAMDYTQHHNFHTINDEDWAMFYGTESIDYTIQVSNTGIDCNAVIEMYDSSGEFIFNHNHTQKGETETLLWTCLKTGLYYVKISNYDELYGNDTYYDLSCSNSHNKDTYETDDRMEQARLIQISNLKTQHHNFHDEKDVDWVKFYALTYKYYVVEVSQTGINCDAAIEIYDYTGNTVDSMNRNDEGEEESLTWECKEEGIYFIKINSATFGEHMDYALSLSVPEGTAPAYITGWVRDEYTLNPLPNACVKLDNSMAVIVNEGGAYCLPCEAGDHHLTAEFNGYHVYSLEKYFEAFSTVEENINMVAEYTLDDVIWGVKVLAGMSVDENSGIGRQIELAEIIYMLSTISNY